MLRSECCCYAAHAGVCVDVVAVFAFFMLAKLVKRGLQGDNVVVGGLLRDPRTGGGK